MGRDVLLFHAEEAVMAVFFFLFCFVFLYIRNRAAVPWNSFLALL